MTGYLATINSAEEFNYISWNLRLRNAWISATDSAVEGTWKYGSSPLIGQNVGFTEWHVGEPSCFFNEDCASYSIYGFSDRSCTSSLDRILIEFECVSPKLMVQGVCTCTCLTLVDEWNSYCLNAIA